ncbi:hypothetical protein ACFYZ8_33280 [Streptomyces sp. NPDC001668]|uniref:hypothetical protein n=1 Tax=Streptomyces sp. NPDC001668 TaxID=3364598 RepID=UPI00367601FA
MSPDERRKTIRELAATASREQLLTAVLDALADTESAQRALDYDDYGVGSCRDQKVVEAEHAARSGVGDDVERSFLTALGG